MAERGFDVDRGTHGTKYIPGMTEVVPASADSSVRQVHGGLADPDKAFYSAHGPDVYGRTAEQSGWTWANVTSNNQPDWVGEGLNKSTVQGRPVVHQVTPVGQVGADRNLNPYGKVGNELTADRLNITETDWIRPPTYSVGTQGTLPNENWNRYGEGFWGDDQNNLELQTRSEVQRQTVPEVDPRRSEILGQQQFF